MVYTVFEKYPFRNFSVNDVLQKVNKEKYPISERTVYRTIERLVDKGKIFCSDIIDGHRQFQLSKTDYFDLICRNCSSKISIKMNKQDKLAKEIYEQYKFDVSSVSVEYYGICKSSCLKENIRTN